jgi:hypothetical protein
VSGRRPPQAYAIDDHDYGYVHGPRVYGVIRCEEGDRATWDLLARGLLAMLGADPERIAPPEWRWYRMNPDPTGEYAWLLAVATGPGRGNWMGAKVIEANTGSGEVDGV